MIHLVREELEAAGLPKQHIHFELFTSGLTAADKERISKIVEKKVEGTEVTIIDGGKEFHFMMGEDFDNLLDGAIAAGADHIVIGRPIWQAPDPRAAAQAILAELATV